MHHSGRKPSIYIISLYGWGYFVYADTVFGFYVFWGRGGGGMLSWMFWHDYLDTCCFECLICVCFVVLYLPLFSAIELVSHGKTLSKYAHYHYLSIE